MLLRTIVSLFIFVSVAKADYISVFETYHLARTLDIAEEVGADFGSFRYDENVIPDEVGDLSTYQCFPVARILLVRNIMTNIEFAATYLSDGEMDKVEEELRALVDLNGSTYKKCFRHEVTSNSDIVHIIYKSNTGYLLYFELTTEN